MFKVKPADNFNVIVEEDGQVNQVLGLLDAFEALSVLPLFAVNYAGQVEVQFSYGGFQMLYDVKEIACQLAGFSGFALTKAMAGQKVNF